MEFVEATWDKDKPLEKIEGETLRANQALFDYATMGIGRSLAKLQQLYREDTTKKPPTRHLKVLSNWSVAYHWQARIGDFDLLEKEERLRRREQRIIELEEKDWQAGEALRELANKILEEGPKFTKTRHVKINGQDVIMLALDGPMAIRAAEAASKLQRLSTNETTENITLSGAALDAAIQRELDRQLAELADRGKAGVSVATEAKKNAQD